MQNKIHSVETLDLGATNIDLMRERIDRLINGLISVAIKNGVLPTPTDHGGLVEAFRLFAGVVSAKIQFESDTCTWIIDARPSKYGVHCFRRSEAAPTCVYSNTRGAEGIRLADVQFVYENRKIISDGLQQKFPRLFEVLEPVAQAGKITVI